MDVFKVPHTIPQDLLLIQDLVNEPFIPTQPAPASVTRNVSDDDCIDSSGSEGESEIEMKEIEADLLEKPDETLLELTSKTAPESDSDSTSDSGSDGPQEDIALREFRFIEHDADADDDYDDAQAANPAGVYLRTKNELQEVDFPVPDTQKVGPTEILEKVGVVLSIVDNAVIVKGNAADNAGKASERALDSETLLVFENRDVLGYVYETFGPTSQPLYQVKFDERFPLDQEKVRVAREVFHVPQRSNFVFLSQIKHFKGSDASNVNDEEPAEDEIEFSDDEQEAAFKSSRKQRRAGSRTGSVTSSRHTTPIPSQMRDQDLTEQFLDPNPYAEHGAYDFDYAASGRSRPPPIPYDDPYADGYNADTMIPSLPQASPVLHERQEQRDETSAGLDRRQHPYRRNSTARARGQRGGARGRGRGRERADRGRERSVQRRSSAPSPNRYAVINVPQHDEPYDPRSPQPLSPSPIAVATATGEYSGGSMATPSPTTTQHSISSAWSFPHQQNYNFNSPGYQHPYVQPHINPRFASAFGIDVGYLQQAQMVTPSYGQNAYEGLDTEQRPSQENWLEEWTVYGSQQDVPGSGSSV